MSRQRSSTTPAHRGTLPGEGVVGNGDDVHPSSQSSTSNGDDSSTIAAIFANSLPVHLAVSATTLTDNGRDSAASAATTCAQDDEDMEAQRQPLRAFIQSCRLSREGVGDEEEEEALDRALEIVVDNDRSGGRRTSADRRRTRTAAVVPGSERLARAVGELSSGGPPPRRLRRQSLHFGQPSSRSLRAISRISYPIRPSSPPPSSSVATGSPGDDATIAADESTATMTIRHRRRATQYGDAAVCGSLVQPGGEIVLRQTPSIESRPSRHEAGPPRQEAGTAGDDQRTPAPPLLLPPMLMAGGGGGSLDESSDVARVDPVGRTLSPTPAAGPIEAVGGRGGFLPGSAGGSPRPGQARLPRGGRRSPRTGLRFPTRRIPFGRWNVEDAATGELVQQLAFEFRADTEQRRDYETNWKYYKNAANFEAYIRRYVLHCPTPLPVG